MNESTGTIYRTEAEIAAAQARGERLTMLDGEATRDIESALNRHERRKQAKLARRAARPSKRKR